MKKFLTRLLAFAFLSAISAVGYAQQTAQPLFQDSEVHMSQPEVRVFVTPQVADLEMVYPGKSREEYQQFFNIKSIETLTEGEFDNLKKRALYSFANEHGADLIIEPIFNSTVSEKDTKRILITVTGYPAKYVNFRPLGKSQADLDMVRIVYPAEYQKVSK